MLHSLQRIMNVKYAFPPNLRISAECYDLLSRIFVANPVQRITIEDIKKHAWFLRNLPAELVVRGGVGREAGQGGGAGWKRRGGKQRQGLGGRGSEGRR